MQFLGFDSVRMDLVVLWCQADIGLSLSNLEVLRVLDGELDWQLDVDRAEHADVQGEDLASLHRVGQDQVSKEILSHQQVGTVRHHSPLCRTEKWKLSCAKSVCR